MARIIDGKEMNMIGDRVRQLRTVTDIELYGLAQVFQVSIDSLFR